MGIDKGDLRSILTAEDRLIASRYATGESSVTLAIEFGVSRSHINRILKVLEVPRRPSPSVESLPQVTKDTVQTLYLEGVSASSIANAVGLDKSVVAGLLKAGNSAMPDQNDFDISSRAKASSKAPTLESRLMAIQGIKEAYESGESVNQIAVRLGLTPVQVRSLIRKQGGTFRKGREPSALTRDQELRVIEEYQAGDGLTKLGQRYGVSTAAISNALKRNNVRIRTEQGQRRFTEVTETLIVKNYENGESAADLASAFEVSEKTILNVLRRNGVTPRPSNRARKPIDETSARDIYKRYVAGEPVSAIARAHGISRDRIKVIAIAQGADPRPKRVSPNPSNSSR